MTEGERLARLEEGMEWLKKEMAAVVDGLSSIAEFMKSLAAIQAEHKTTGDAIGRAFTEIHEIKAEIKSLKETALDGCKDYEKRMVPRIGALEGRVAELEKKEPVANMYFSGVRGFLYLVAAVISNIVTAVIVAYMVKR